MASHNAMELHGFFVTNNCLWNLKVKAKTFNEHILLMKKILAVMFKFEYLYHYKKSGISKAVPVIAVKFALIM